MPYQNIFGDGRALNEVWFFDRTHTSKASDSPQAVQDGPVRVEPDHAVLHGHPVQKGLLVVQEIGVRQPQLVCHPVVQGQVEREVVVGQAFVPPALLEVHGDGVILGEKHPNVILGPLLAPL